MSRFDILKEYNLAVDQLASYLNQGNLILFLGAGISSGFGLPNWLSLVNGIRLSNGLAALPASSGAAELQTGADEVKDILGSDTKLIEAVRKQLYSTLSGVEIQNLVKHPLLMAIAALLMGGKRGRVKRVITLNYDNMLQWTLSVFGFSVKTIHKLPSLENAADVTIYHVHGFLPLPESSEEPSDFLILGKESVNFRLGAVDPWVDMIKHLLYSNICLFIGLSPNSLSDPALSPFYNTIGREVLADRPLGSWIVMQDDPIPNSKLAEFQRNNIYPLKMSSPEEISIFLFEICKKAGEYIRN